MSNLLCLLFDIFTSLKRIYTFTAYTTEIKRIDEKQ